MSMTRRKRLQNAERFFVMAHDFQNLGFYVDAAHYYKKSIRMYPTPEAYTHLAWAHSFLGEYDQAIEFCKVAISLDPDYGNPYNDIGAYMLEKGQIDAAIPYLRRAAKARRYDQPHFAHYNLGRAWERKHQMDKALGEYKRSWEISPDYEPARMAYFRLVRLTN
ncbi:MAG: tetratricopeptide repeat protein [candidate division Zixibacteria bacterium]|nr:tetratricopeptide repeat protein [candidate division Zixibacteria bacterium]